MAQESAASAKGRQGSAAALLPVSEHGVQGRCLQYDGTVEGHSMVRLIVWHLAKTDTTAAAR